MQTVSLRNVVSTAIILCLLLAFYETVQQWRDSRFVRLTTARVLEHVPNDRRAQVLAIRDYIRSHVTTLGAPVWNRPFLRASAAETLRSGKGYCGEVSRTFICMAGSVGIDAQRINLYGSKLHVVAEAHVGPNQDYIVDAQNPPTIVDLATLDEVIRRPEFDDYYTLNLRRLHMSWLITRVTLRMGPFTYWTENPAALKAFFFLSLAALLVILRVSRAAMRRVMLARGWIHRTELERRFQSNRQLQRL